jgi:hypothetical protein
VHARAMSGDDGEWLSPNASNASVPYTLNNTSTFTTTNTTLLTPTIVPNGTSPLPFEAVSRALDFDTGSIFSLVFFLCSALYFVAHFAYLRRRS